MEHRTLVGTITDKAAISFGKNINKDNVKEWFDHWIKTGRLWADELEQEGLVLTAKAIRDHVQWQSDHPLGG